MKLLARFALLGVAIAVLPWSVLAGPNEGVYLNPHGNVDGVETNGDPCLAIALPDTCGELSSTAVGDGLGVEWFLIVAGRDSDPLGFTTITFGIGNYDGEACYIAVFGPCNQAEGPLEIPSDGWPLPDEDGVGTSVSWSPSCIQGTLVPVYYFGIYAYGPEMIPLGDYYPGQTAAVVSCDDPVEEDVITAFGVLGIGGEMGEIMCPATPTRKTTWGQIKNIYR